MGNVVFIGVDPSQNNTSVAFRFARGGTVYAANLTKACLNVQLLMEAFKLDGYSVIVGVERNPRRTGSWAASYSSSCSAMRQVVSSRASKPEDRSFVVSQTWQSVCGANRTPIPATVLPKKASKERSLRWSLSNGLDTQGDDNISDAYGILVWVCSTRFDLYAALEDDLPELPPKVGAVLAGAKVLKNF